MRLSKHYQKHKKVKSEWQRNLIDSQNKFFVKLSSTEYFQKAKNKYNRVIFNGSNGKSLAPTQFFFEKKLVGLKSHLKKHVETAAKKILKINHENHQKSCKKCKKNAKIALEKITEI